MKRLKKVRNFNLAMWIVLLIVVAFLSVALCSIIEFLGNEFLSSSQDLAVGDFWLYEGAVRLWRSVYVAIIFTSTGLLITSGLVTVFTPQSPRFVQKVLLRKHRLTTLDEEIAYNSAS